MALGSAGPLALFLTGVVAALGYVVCAGGRPGGSAELVGVAVALRGNLKDFGIAEVFQLIGQQRKTGVLEIVANEQTVRLAFDRRAPWSGRRRCRSPRTWSLGERLVRCGLVTAPELSRLLDRERGFGPFPGRPGSRQRGLDRARRRADFRPDHARHHFPGAALVGGLLPLLRRGRAARPAAGEAAGRRADPDGRPADGGRVADLRGAGALGRHHLPASCGSFEVYRQRVRCRRPRCGCRRPRPSSPLVDGRLPVRRIIDLSRLGTFEATRVLAELRAAGLHRTAVDQAGPAGRRDSAIGWRQPVVKRARWWLAAAFPVALLALMVSAAFNICPLEGDNPGFPILRSPLDEPATSSRSAGCGTPWRRTAICGGPGRDLERARSHGARSGATALTPADGPAYYYARREGGVVAARTRALSQGVAARHGLLGGPARQRVPTSRAKQRATRRKGTR